MIKSNSNIPTWKITILILISTVLSQGQSFSQADIITTGQWQSSAINTTSRIFTFECDIEIQDIPDNFAIGLSQNPPGTWKNLACIVRFNGEQNGIIDMRHGGEYFSGSSIPVDSDRTYHIRIEVDIAKHTYSVWITPEGDNEIILGEHCDFRIEQQDAGILNWAGFQASAGSPIIKNIEIKPDKDATSEYYTPSPSDIDLLRQRTIALYTGQSIPSQERRQYTDYEIKHLYLTVNSILQQKLWTHDPDLKSPAASENVAAFYQKILIMSQAYCTPGQQLHNDEELLKVIISCLNRGQKWIKPGAPRPGNWFFWKIGIPERLLPVVLLLENNINQNLLEDIKLSLRGLMGENPIMNGPNAVYEGYNHLLDGMMRNAGWRIKKAMDFIQLELAVTQNSTGILEDYSFQFHGRVPYSGGYGVTYLETVSKVILLTHETNYELPREKINLVEQYILRQARWPIIGNIYDPLVTGRAIEYSKSAQRLVDSILLTASVDTPNQKQLRNLVAELMHNSGLRPSLLTACFADQIPASSEQPPTGIRYLYRSDMMIARRLRHYLSIKMFSDHVRDYEGQWGQNLSGWNLSYGTTYFAYRGDELWGPNGKIVNGYDWDHIPGTTSRTGARPATSSNHGQSCFVGGAVGEYSGMCGFELLPAAGDFRARKSYFVFDKGFVAVGNGITSSKSGESVNTTITQWPLSYKDSPIILSSDRKITQNTWHGESEMFDWAYCDRIGYLTGSTPVKIKKDNGILTIWLDHGGNPQNANYSYTVLPNCSEKTLKSYTANPSVHVLCNTSAIHAVEDVKNKKVGIMFWEPGSYAGITVDHPAVVFLEHFFDGDILTVSNPLHTVAVINLKISTPLSLTTRPKESQASEMNGETHITLDTQLGRMYRFGWGKVDAHQYPREDISSLENFKIAVENTDDGALLDVFIPSKVKTGDFRLLIYKSKGIINKELDENDLIGVSPSGAYRYRWTDKRIQEGYYNIRLTDGLKSSWLGFKVKYDQKFNDQVSQDAVLH